MGVPGLWDILRPAASTHSLMHLAMSNQAEGQREDLSGYRLGIDISLWFHHSQKSVGGGENAQLRLILYRLARLHKMLVLPVLVFDGPHRPEWKRGRAGSGRVHWMVASVKEMAAAFGFQCHQAPGEAEAELVYLEREGLIDGMLTDDVDALLFGGQTVIQNPSSGLNSNKNNPVLNAAGEDDGNHVRIFTASTIKDHVDVKLNQSGLILIAILVGGDYKSSEGSDLAGCGIHIAYGLARCGFGDELVHAVCSSSSEIDLRQSLKTWRDALRKELATNARGFLPRKQPRLASNLTDKFPNLAVVRAYTHPITSASLQRHVSFDWNRQSNITALATFCENKLGWSASKILKYFRNTIWTGSIIRMMWDDALL
ncbi:PIN domain-like protein, partial [Clavulina sp. PMI_390]